MQAVQPIYLPFVNHFNLRFVITRVIYFIIFVTLFIYSLRLWALTGLMPTVVLTAFGSFLRELLTLDVRYGASGDIIHPFVQSCEDLSRYTQK